MCLNHGSTFHEHGSCLCFVCDFVWVLVAQAGFTQLGRPDQPGHEMKPPFGLLPGGQTRKGLERLQAWGGCVEQYFLEWRSAYERRMVPIFIF